MGLAVLQEIQIGLNCSKVQEYRDLARLIKILSFRGACAKHGICVSYSSHILHESCAKVLRKSHVQHGFTQVAGILYQSAQWNVEAYFPSK